MATGQAESNGKTAIRNETRTVVRHVNCSFSLSLCCPSSCCCGCLQHSRICSKNMRAASKLSKQVILNNSPDIQTACLLSQPLLYHSLSLTMPLRLQTLFTDRLLGHPLLHAQLRHKHPTSYCRSKASRGLVLSGFLLCSTAGLLSCSEKRKAEQRKATFL